MVKLGGLVADKAKVANSTLIILVLALMLPGARADAPGLLQIKKSAEAGDPAAQRQLGQNFERSFNFSEAEKWYLRAAVRGDVEAVYYLAHYYTAGKRKLNVGADVSAKPKAAFALFNFLSAIGHKGAQYDLGRRYCDGAGVARDPFRAYQLFRLSGSLSAKPALDRLILELKTEDVEEAERLVKAFKPMPFKDAFSILVRSGLDLQNVFASKDQKVAAINNVVFGEGETNEVEVAGLPLEIKCLKIERAEVALLFRGETFVLSPAPAR